jgi:hypothetical protein
LRKLLLTGAIALIPGAAEQLLCGVIVSIIYAVLVASCLPFEHAGDNRLALVDAVQVLLTLMLGMYIYQRNEANGAARDSTAIFCDVLLLVLNFAVIFVAIVQAPPIVMAYNFLMVKCCRCCKKTRTSKTDDDGASIVGTAADSGTTVVSNSSSGGGDSKFRGAAVVSNSTSGGGGGSKIADGDTNPLHHRTTLAALSPSSAHAMPSTENPLLTKQLAPQSKSGGIEMMSATEKMDARRKRRVERRAERRHNRVVQGAR